LWVHWPADSSVLSSPSPVGGIWENSRAK
jgi:hypothetical protein